MVANHNLVSFLVRCPIAISVATPKFLVFKKWHWKSH